MTDFVFKLPDLGEGMVEAEIVEWHVAVGDAVREGDPAVDVMTDKATIEVPAPASGTVLRIHGVPGDMIAVGAELMAIATRTDDIGGDTGADAGAEKAQATVAQPAETAVAPTVAATIETAPSLPPSAPAPRREGAMGARVLTTPRIRKVAAEHGIDLRTITGSGPQGRILKSDLDAYLTAQDSGTPPAESGSQAIRATNAHEQKVQKVIGVRRVIAERVARSYREIPHFSYVEEVDVTELIALKDHLNETLNETRNETRNETLNEGRGRHLTLLVFVATALIKSLAEHAGLNAHYEADENLLRTFEGVHLGIATQTEEGLKVPVVKDAHLLDLWALSEQIAACTQAARDGNLPPAGLTGSTITITSLGRLGGIASTPLINYPEVAILGVNKAVARPAVANGQIAIRTLMNLSGSFDHRFIDGYDAAAWIQTIKHSLEHPARLWLEVPK